MNFPRGIIEDVFIMLPIVTAPNNILSLVTAPIKKIDKNVLLLIEEMKDTLSNTHDPEGVGLAAPQIGKSLQLFIAKPTQKSPFIIFINPIIIKASDTMQELKRPKSASLKKRGSKKPARFARLDARMAKALASTSQRRGESARRAKLEGCLSLPTIWGTVLRHTDLTLSFLDEKGNSHTEYFKGFMSTIIQHEVDHLSGTLFPKRVLEQKGKLFKSHKDEAGEDVFDQIEI